MFSLSFFIFIVLPANLNEPKLFKQFYEINNTVNHWQPLNNSMSSYFLIYANINIKQYF